MKINFPEVDFFLDSQVQEAIERYDRLMKTDKNFRIAIKSRRTL